MCSRATVLVFVSSKQVFPSYVISPMEKAKRLNNTSKLNIVVIENGVQLGMGSALETLCGQAYGAGQLRMLGIYMQRSWVILFTTALCMLPIYIWAPPILSFFGEAPHISKAAGIIPFIRFNQLVLR